VCGNSPAVKRVSAHTVAAADADHFGWAVRRDNSW
jgi:hypothetical protein